MKCVAARFRAAAAARRGAGRRRRRSAWFDAAAARPRPPDAHATLLARLRTAYPRAPPPPSGAEAWPASLLERWHADGGLRVAALAAEPATPLTRALVDEIGSDLPARPLEPRPSLAAAKVALDAGAAAVLVEGLAVDARADAEAAAAWPRMRAGKLTGGVAGVAPSGAERGDRYLLFGELAAGDWPALAGARDSLMTAAAALGPALRRSDAFVARFSGDGLGYGAHFDGGDGDRPELTCILYAAGCSGGELRLLDEAAGCWWEAAPRRGALVAFRSAATLHKVAPCFSPRVALTTFLSETPDEGAAVVSSLAFSV